MPGRARPPPCTTVFGTERFRSSRRRFRGDRRSAGGGGGPVLGVEVDVEPPVPHGHRVLGEVPAVGRELPAVAVVALLAVGIEQPERPVAVPGLDGALAGRAGRPGGQGDPARLRVVAQVLDHDVPLAAGGVRVEDRAVLVDLGRQLLGLLAGELLVAEPHVHLAPRSEEGDARGHRDQHPDRHRRHRERAPGVALALGDRDHGAYRGVDLGVITATPVVSPSGAVAQKTARPTSTGAGRWTCTNIKASSSSPATTSRSALVRPSSAWRTLWQLPSASATRWWSRPRCRWAGAARPAASSWPAMPARCAS